MSFSRVVQSLFACLPLLALPACGRHAARTKPPPASPFGAADQGRREERVAPPSEGQRLYAALCSSCHGEGGSAGTPLAADLDPPPGDLTRCNFKLRSTPSGDLPTDRDLVRTLYVGLPGSAMPSFGDVLPLPALRALAQQVKQRCGRFAEEEAGEPLPVLDGPGAGTASAAAGARIYRQQGCHSCHGERGEGDGPAATRLRDALGRPIQPRDHTRGVFRSGFRAADVYRAFSTGLDGTPMPALPEGVSSLDRWHLTRYIVSLSARRSRLMRALRERPTWYEPALTRRPPWREK